MWVSLAWVVVPRTVQSLTVPKYRASVGMPAPEYSTLASLSQSLLLLAVLGTCLFAVLDTMREPKTVRIMPLALLLAPWLYIVVRDLFTGQTPATTALVYPATVVALWQLRLTPRILGTLGYAVGTAALVALALGVVFPSGGIFRTDAGSLVMEDKVFLPWGILVGFLTHGNALGQLLVLGLPAVLAIPRRWVRGVLAVMVLVAVVWSTSRTAYLALALMAVVAAFLWLVPRRLRAPVGTATAVAPFVAGALLPFIVRSPEAFASRGLIWMSSIEWWAQSWWTGLGSDWFARLGNTSARLAGTVWHAHSQPLQLLVTGGVVLVVLVGALVLLAAVRAGQIARDGSLFAVLYLVALAGLSITEVTFMFVGTPVVIPVIVVPLAVILFSADSFQGQASTDPERRSTDEPRTPVTRSVGVPGLELEGRNR